MNNGILITQLSIFVEDQKGRLALLTELLRDNGIDIRAVSVADTREFGILRLIVDDPRKAASVLKEEGFTVSLTSVLGVGIADRPGGLCEVMELMRDSGINVDYMYAYISQSQERAYVILRASDNAQAALLLAEKGFDLLADAQI